MLFNARVDSAGMEHVTAQGVEVPALGYGTARMDTDEERYEAISAALDAGYRHIDTAQVYGSEGAVGDAVADADVSESELFVTTKLSDDNRDRESVLDSGHKSRQRLGLDSIDLLLIHSPNDDVSHEETLGAMNDLRDDGVVEHLGVSNFSVDQTREAMEQSDAPIVTNQVEYNARERQDHLLRFCVDQGIMLTAYSPLGVGDLLEEGALAAVGDAHGKTAAQVAIRWLLQQPQVSTIPMSSSPEHVRENFDVLDFELSDGEMRELFALEGELDEDLAAEFGL
jgi:diketogulonate reductase-like aldo/keto reductase